jgi:hypothetical protein
MKSSPPPLARGAITITIGAAIVLAAATVSFTSRANRAGAFAVLLGSSLVGGSLGNRGFAEGFPSKLT